MVAVPAQHGREVTCTLKFSHLFVRQQLNCATAVPKNNLVLCWVLLPAG